MLVACPSPRTAMPGPYVKKEKLKVKQETTDTAKKVKVHGKTNDDVIVICDADEIVVIDADIDGSDLPAGADDTNGGIPAWNGAAAAKHIPSQVLALSAVECTTVAIHLLMLFSPLMIW